MNQNTIQLGQRVGRGEQAILQFLQTPQSVSKPEQKLLAQQYVNILNQNIFEKINWDHQILLLSGQKDHERLQNMILISQLIYQESLEKTGGNISLQNHFGTNKERAFSELKTPELLYIQQSNQCNSLILEQNDEGIVSAPKMKVGCSCKKSQCLKMYCECFRNGNICENCECCDCKNKTQDSSERQKAIMVIQQKSPQIFLMKQQYKGCHCRKSQCSKNYCECYMNGLKCGKYCKCIQCSNGKKNRILKNKKSRKNRKQNTKKYSIDI